MKSFNINIIAGYTWKRCHDSTASEESEEFSVTRKKSCRKAAFSESESGSYEERHADICGMGRVSCDPSSKGKFQITKLAIKTSRNSKGKASQYQDESTAQTSNSNVIMRMHLFLHNVRCHQL